LLFFLNPDLDLKNQVGQQSFFDLQKLNLLYVSSPNAGGIRSKNNYFADFLDGHLMMQLNLVDQALLTDLKTFSKITL
jgi:hypothetical protein